VTSRAAPMIRQTGFGFLSDFGFRISDFELWISGCPHAAGGSGGGTGHAPIGWLAPQSRHCVD